MGPFSYCLMFGWLVLQQEVAVAHNLFFAFRVTEPDVEAQANDVDVCRGPPRCAGVGTIGVAECDVYAGEFLILKNVADDAFDADIRADGELTDAV